MADTTDEYEDYTISDAETQKELDGTEPSDFEKLILSWGPLGCSVPQPFKNDEEAAKYIRLKIERYGKPDVPEPLKQNDETQCVSCKYQSKFCCF